MWYLVFLSMIFLTSFDDKFESSATGLIWCGKCHKFNFHLHCIDLAVCSFHGPQPSFISSVLHLKFYEVRVSTLRFELRLNSWCKERKLSKKQVYRSTYYYISITCVEYHPFYSLTFQNHVSFSLWLASKTPSKSIKAWRACAVVLNNCTFSSQTMWCFRLFLAYFYRNFSKLADKEFTFIYQSGGMS